MNDHTSQRPAADLSELRDDGGRPLPATPLEMLSRARRTQTRRRIATAAVSGVAAIALLAGGMAFATQLQNRAIETAVTPPTHSASTPPTSTDGPRQADKPDVSDVAKFHSAVTAATERAEHDGHFVAIVALQPELAVIMASDPTVVRHLYAPFGARVELLAGSISPDIPPLTQKQKDMITEVVTHTRKLRAQGHQVRSNYTNGDEVVLAVTDSPEIRGAYRRFGSSVRLYDEKLADALRARVNQLKSRGAKAAVFTFTLPYIVYTEGDVATMRKDLGELAKSVKVESHADVDSLHLGS